MRSERGQATVEWIGILLLVTLALAALSRLAPRDDDHALASTLAHSITHPDARDRAGQPGARDRAADRRVVGIRREKRTDSPPPESRAFIAPPLVPHLGSPPRLGAPLRLPEPPALVRRVRGGAGAAWRRAWYACLVYERFRWAFLHPESRFPGYTMPPEEVLRILNDCVSPVDLVRDWPALRGLAGGP